MHKINNDQQSNEPLQQPVVQQKKDSAGSHSSRGNNLGAIQAKRGNKPIQAKQKPIQAKQKPIQAKQKPIQRNAKPSSNTKSSNIAQAMGQQYGVDTSGLQMTHNSSFPGKVNAEATIQGNKIDFAPGKDTEKNIKHEVAHHIINTKRGTPPQANANVNGQAVNTTDEAAADKMMNTPLQAKASPEAGQIPAVTSGNGVVQNKSSEVVQAKIQVDGKFYGKESQGQLDVDLNMMDKYKGKFDHMLGAKGTYVFNNWKEVQDHLDGKPMNKGMLGDKTVTLQNKLYVIGESHSDSPKGTIEGGINPSNIIYEGSLVQGAGKSGKGNMDHKLLQGMFIISEVGRLYQKDEPVEGHALTVLSSLKDVPEVGAVYTAVQQGAGKDDILAKVAKGYNDIRVRMEGDAKGRQDKLTNNGNMWGKMKDKAMYQNADLTSASDFETAGDDVFDVRDYFFANQIQANASRPMIAVMGNLHVKGTTQYLKDAGVSDIKVVKDVSGTAKEFGDAIGHEVGGDNGSENNVFEDMPDAMKKAKEPEQEPQLPQIQPSGGAANVPKLSMKPLGSKNTKRKKPKPKRKSKPKSKQKPQQEQPAENPFGPGTSPVPDSEYTPEQQKWEEIWK